MKRRTLKKGEEGLGKSLGHGIAVVENLAYWRILDQVHELKGFKIDVKPFYWGKERNVLIEDLKKRTFEILDFSEEFKGEDLKGKFEEFGDIGNLYVLDKREDSGVRKAILIFVEQRVARRVSRIAESEGIFFKGKKLKIRYRWASESTADRTSPVVASATTKAIQSPLPSPTDTRITTTHQNPQSPKNSKKLLKSYFTFLTNSQKTEKNSKKSKGKYFQTQQNGQEMSKKPSLLGLLGPMTVMSFAHHKTPTQSGYIGDCRREQRHNYENLVLNLPESKPKQRKILSVKKEFKLYKLF